MEWHATTGDDKARHASIASDDDDEHHDEDERYE
jgi:hypothetical protein